MLENFLVLELLRGASLGPWRRNSKFDEDIEIDPMLHKASIPSYQHVLIFTTDTTPNPSIPDDIQTNRHRQAAFLRRIFQRTPAAPALLQSVILKGLNVFFKMLDSEIQYLASFVSYKVIKMRDFEVF